MPSLTVSLRRSGAPRETRGQWVSRAGKATFYPCLHEEAECGSVLMTFKGRGRRPSSGSPRPFQKQRAIAGPRAFNGSCDDEGVPLICPTCQVFAQSASVPATGCYLAWGRFRYFWLGATATWRRKRLDAYDGPLTPRTKLEDSAVPTRRCAGGSLNPFGMGIFISP